MQTQVLADTSRSHPPTRPRVPVGQVLARSLCRGETADARREGSELDIQGPQIYIAFQDPEKPQGRNANSWCRNLGPNLQGHSNQNTPSHCTPWGLAVSPGSCKMFKIHPKRSSLPSWRLSPEEQPQDIMLFLRVKLSGFPHRLDMGVIGTEA